MVSDTAPMTHEWHPSPRQEEVLNIIAGAPEGSISLIGYGGAAGGAKTNLLGNLPIDISLECPGAVSLVGRQDFLDLQVTTLVEFDKSIPPGVECVKYNSSPVYRDLRLPTWPKGLYSRVYFRGLSDWQSLLSTEFGWIFIDEAQETQLRAVMALITRLRHLPEKKRGIVCSFNPFPSWPVDWFMRRDLDSETLELFEKASVKLSFVPSKIADNPYLPTGYQAMLEATLAADPYMRAVLVDGDPDAAMGGMLYFDQVSVAALERYASEPDEKTMTYADGLRTAANGEVLIWERPIPGEIYYGGADTADGKGEEMASLGNGGGSDRNAAAIYKLKGNVQVAAIYGRQEEHEFAKILARTGNWYNDALLAVENNRKSVVDVMRSLGYPNLYKAPRVGDIHVQPVRTQQARLRQYEYGVSVNMQTRPVLLANFRQTLTMRVMHPRDPRFFREQRDFLAGEKPQARQGMHDDVVFSHMHANEARVKAARPKEESLQHIGTSF